MLNRIARAAVIAITLAATITTAAADTPAATGTLRYPSSPGASWGTFQVFATSSNSFGFWIRAFPVNQHVLTVVPYEVESDGQIACWYIEYAITGGSANLAQTEGWQWSEVAGGRVLINPATATATTVDGTTWETYQMVNTARNPDVNPRVVPIRLSVP